MSLNEESINLEKDPFFELSETIKEYIYSEKTIYKPIFFDK